MILLVFETVERQEECRLCIKTHNFSTNHAVSLGCSFHLNPGLYAVSVGVITLSLSSHVLDALHAVNECYCSGEN